MKKRLRLIAFLVIMSFMLVMAFTGCSQKDDAPVQTTGTEQATTRETEKETDQATTRETVKETEQEKDPFEENVKIKMAFWWGSSFGNDPWYDDICEMFNVDFEFINLDWSDWEQKVRLMAASDDMPDVTAGQLPGNDYFNFAEQDMLKAIPKDLSEYPNLEKYMDADVLKLFEVNGDMYAIPRGGGRDIQNAMTSFKLFVRKDWMEKVGVTKDPETITEFLDMCKAFVDQNASGGSQTIGYTTAAYYGPNVPDFNYLFAFSMGANLGTWEIMDGKWQPSEFNPKHIEWIKLAREYYNKGAVDKDFALNKGVQGRDKFVAGNTGAILLSVTANDVENLYRDFENANTGKIAKDSIKLMMFPNAFDGKIYVPGDLGFGSATYFGAKTTEQVQDRMLRIIDYLLTDEGLKFCFMGKEGRDYEMVDGKVNWLTPIDAQTGQPTPILTMYPTTLFRVIPTWNVDYSKIDPTVPQWIRDAYNEHDDYMRANAVKMEKNFEVEFLQTPAKSKWNYYANYHDGIARIIVGTGDVEKMFNDLIAELMASGGNEAIKEVNEEMGK